MEHRTGLEMYCKARLLTVFDYKVLRQPKLYKPENRCLSRRRFFWFMETYRNCLVPSPREIIDC